MATILVVDDEPMVREVLTGYLERDGHRVLEAATSDEARAGFASDPDLILLDIMLPGESGLELLRSLDGKVPVIMLTALAEEADRILGLELGADDYVTKPFSPREVTARVRSVLRRATRAPEPLEPLEIGDLRIDPAAREVVVDGSPVDLTAKEFELLHFLATSPRQVFSRQQLLEQVWDSSADWQDPATVTVHIGRIRTKIEPDPSEPQHIQTVWGVGYKFEPWPA
ncbi:MAG: response regulator transcription factor [Acidimicrobiia bacterium]|nr:response regulator transcription factor [Acidimicrobiia bacterium]